MKLVKFIRLTIANSAMSLSRHTIPINPEYIATYYPAAVEGNVGDGSVVILANGKSILTNETPEDIHAMIEKYNDAVFGGHWDGYYESDEV